MNHEDVSRVVADRIAATYGNFAVAFPEYSPIDWYIVREKRYGAAVCALLEVKGRTGFALETLGSAMASMRKWLALYHAGLAVSAPAIYAWGFSDGIWCCDVLTTPVGPPRLAGHSAPRAGQPHDQEPVLYVDIAQLRKICGEEWISSLTGA